MSEPKIIYCPTAYAAPSTGEISDSDRKKIASYQAERETHTREKKLPFFAAFAPRPPSAAASLGCTSQKTETTPIKKEDPRPAPFLAGSEITTRVFSNGRSEVTTVDHQGRHYVSHFGPARNGMGNYQGTTWVNRAAFESVDVK